MYRGLAGAPVGADRARPEDRRVSHHRRDIGRNVRVRHRVRPDVGWLQLEAQLPMVGHT